MTNSRGDVQQSNNHLESHTCRRVRFHDGLTYSAVTFEERCLCAESWYTPCHTTLQQSRCAHVCFELLRRPSCVFQHQRSFHFLFVNKRGVQILLLLKNLQQTPACAIMIGMMFACNKGMAYNTSPRHSLEVLSLFSCIFNLSTTVLTGYNG